MSADSAERRDRQIAESVEALSMLKDQICGMYAALVEQKDEQFRQAVRLEASEKRLNALIGGLPRDPLTLASITRAADRVESTAADFPEVVKTAIDELGAPVATKFTTAVAKPTADINVAAAAATAAAGVYSRAVRFATWKATGVALLITLAAVAAVLAGLMTWWIPSLEEIQARKVERDQLMAVIADLGKRGGKMNLTTCDGRLCVQIDDKAQSYTVHKTGESLRVIKGY